MATTEDKTSKRGPPTTWAQYKAMVEWLQIESNFNLIVGNATKGMTQVNAGAKLKKGDGYQMLTDYVNDKAPNGSFIWKREHGCM